MERSGGEPCRGAGSRPEREAEEGSLREDPFIRAPSEKLIYLHLVKT